MSLYRSTARTNWRRFLSDGLLKELPLPHIDDGNGSRGAWASNNSWT